MSGHSGENSSVSTRRGRAALWHQIRPKRRSTQVMVGILCAIVGFAIAVQWDQRHTDHLPALREGELVRRIDEVTRSNQTMEEQIDRLAAERDQLATENQQAEAAARVARNQEVTEGILSGQLPAHGPGITMEITFATAPLADTMVNVLEELRNAGAEVIQVNNTRITTDSFFTSSGNQLSLSGSPITSPMTWTAIGDPDTLDIALKIRGGAVEQLRQANATVNIVKHDDIQISSTVRPSDPEHAQPVP